MVKSIIISLAFLALLLWGVRQYNMYMRTEKRLEELDNLAKSLVQQDLRDMFKSSKDTQLTTKIEHLPVSMPPDDISYLQKQYITLFQKAMHEHYQQEATEQESTVLLESFQRIRDAHMKAALTVEQQPGKL